MNSAIFAQAQCPATVYTTMRDTRRVIVIVTVIEAFSKIYILSTIPILVRFLVLVTTMVTKVDHGN